ncbi:related to makorin ring zinc finger protein [Ustilago trichophora]|uniref:Related to makorin ring zinc finger protein n=1 Tax=Ustilago trichophora TaxID=86804 RepID=A0A5C3DWY3_9BASI|nr:related to makorin ring zinc finger protein [Ustilago trichophora]
MQANAGPSNTPASSDWSKKDTPCRYYYRSGSCKRGVKCLFSHGETRKTGQPSTPPHSPPKPSPDATFSAQTAEFTPGSAFPSRLSASADAFEPRTSSDHDDDEWQDELPSPQSSLTTPSKLKKQTSVMKGVPASVSQNTEPCSICMDIPVVYAQHPSCDHSFCPPCLTRWRRQEGQAKIKNCPVCRTSSSYTFVTPQPFTAGARTLALQRFRDRAAATPCKNFGKSLTLGNKFTKPFCVFGDECLFLHEIDGQLHKFGHGRCTISRNKKGRKRLTRIVERSRAPIQAEFFARIQDMDERVRMFLSTRALLSARSTAAVL